MRGTPLEEVDFEALHAWFVENGFKWGGLRSCALYVPTVEELRTEAHRQAESLEDKPGGDWCSSGRLTTQRENGQTSLLICDGKLNHPAPRKRVEVTK